MEQGSKPQGVNCWSMELLFHQPSDLMKGTIFLTWIAVATISNAKVEDCDCYRFAIWDLYYFWLWSYPSQDYQSSRSVKVSNLVHWHQSSVPYAIITIPRSNNEIQCSLISSCHSRGRWQCQVILLGHGKDKYYSIPCRIVDQQLYFACHFVQ
jgi:hypothetical protein